MQASQLEPGRHTGLLLTQTPTVSLGVQGALYMDCLTTAAHPRFLVREYTSGVCVCVCQTGEIYITESQATLKVSLDL